MKNPLQIALKFSARWEIWTKLSKVLFLIMFLPSESFFTIATIPSWSQSQSGQGTENCTLRTRCKTRECEGLPNLPYSNTRGSASSLACLTLRERKPAYITMMTSRPEHRYRELLFMNEKSKIFPSPILYSRTQGLLRVCEEGTRTTNNKNLNLAPSGLKLSRGTWDPIQQHQ